MTLGLGNPPKEMRKGSRGPLSIACQRLLRGDGVNWFSNLWRTPSVVALGQRTPGGEGTSLRECQLLITCCQLILEVKTNWCFCAVQSQYANQVTMGETLPSEEQVTIVEGHYKSR